MMMTAAWMREMKRAACVMLTAVCLTACQQSEMRGLAIRPVTIDEFAKPASLVPSASPSPAAVISTTAATAPTTGPEKTAQPASSSPAPAARSLKAGDQVVVESVIGQVSGRPIFADALLAPIADQLRTESEQSNPHDFLVKAKAIVEGRLRQMIQSELFLAESEASLSQQQQQGLLAMLSQMREKTIAESFGSLSQREKELQEEQGLSLDQYMQLRKNQVLTLSLLNQRITPRVIVSWRDVEREYERQKANFNPPATVTLSRIRLSNTNQKEVIDQVKARLAGGESFDAVAASLEADTVKTLDPFPMTSDDVSDIAIAMTIKPYLKGLRQGQTTQAIVEKDDTSWWHVVKVDQPSTRTIYDVQRELFAKLEKERRDEQLDHYLKSLMEKGNYDQLEEMAKRVLVVAVLRYGR